MFGHPSWKELAQRHKIVKLIDIKLVITAISLASICLNASFGFSEERTIRVGLQKNPPLVFTNEKGTAKGIFVDVIEHIAAQEGWELHYLPCKWNECKRKLRAGDMDLLMAIAYSEERGKKFDFTSEQVFNNWAYIYRSPGADVESIVDLEGKKVATVKGNIHSKGFAKVLESFNIQTDTLEVDDYSDVFRLLDEGKVAAGVVSRLNWLKFEEKFKVEKTSILFNPIKLFFATPRGKNAEIRATIDRHLSRLKKDKNSIYYRSLDNWIAIPAKTVFPIWLKLSLIISVGLLLFSLALNKFLQVKNRQKTVELKEAHERLEKKIEEQTSEMITANQQLVEEINARQEAEIALRRARNDIGLSSSKK